MNPSLGQEAPTPPRHPGSAARPSLLIIVTGDPRQSARPAEAIRIAAGLGAWHTIELTLCLRGAAILALSERVDDLVDSDHFTRYLPMLAEFKRPVLVESGSPFLQELEQPALNYATVSDAELARLAAAATHVARF